MRLDADEITALADALAPLVADVLERRLSERPEWAMSVSEAAAWANVTEDAIRHAKLDKLLALQSAPPQRFLSVAHAATYADLSEDSIRRLIERGDLVGYRPVKGKVLVDRLELERLILGSTKQPATGRGIRRETIT